MTRHMPARYRRICSGRHNTGKQIRSRGDTTPVPKRPPQSEAIYEPDRHHEVTVCATGRDAQPCRHAVQGRSWQRATSTHPGCPDEGLPHVACRERLPNPRSSDHQLRQQYPGEAHGRYAKTTRKGKRNQQGGYENACSPRSLKCVLQYHGTTPHGF